MDEAKEEEREESLWESLVRVLEGVVGLNQRRMTEETDGEEA